MFGWQSLVGEELAEAYAPAPHVFTRRQHSTGDPVPSEAERSAVCGWFAQSVVPKESYAKDSHFEMRDASVRVASGTAAFAFASNLGECGDTRCGCYRLWRPEARGSFTRFVAQRAAMCLRPGAVVRYCTVGSGQLLADFEALCLLVQAGLKIGSIFAVDTEYAELGSSGAGSSKVRSSLQQLAAFFSPAQVLAFGSVSDLEQAARIDGRAYGGVNVYVHCDAGDLDSNASHNLAKSVLAEEGSFFKLNNLGLVAGGDMTHADGGAHPTHSEDTARRRFWRAQLRDGFSIEAMQLRCGALEPVGGVPEDDPAVRDARHARARMWLTQSNQERAAALGLGLYASRSRLLMISASFTYDGGHFSGRYRVVFAGGRGVMAVRAEPSVSSALIGTRARGDEVLAAEERGGWVRVSEEDDHWGWQLSASSSATEAWMLIDGDELDPPLGRLLERVHF